MHGIRIKLGGLQMVEKYTLCSPSNTLSFMQKVKRRWQNWSFKHSSEMHFDYLDEENINICIGKSNILAGKVDQLSKKQYFFHSLAFFTPSK